jgi:hypothetical protein
MQHFRPLAAVAFIAGLLTAPAFAADAPYALTIKDHLFTPSEIHLPADKPAVLHIKNLDASPEEFESEALKIEKVITGKGEATVRLRAMKAGSYPFVGEYNAKTAHGVIVVK